MIRRLLRLATVVAIWATVCGGSQYSQGQDSQGQDVSGRGGVVSQEPVQAGAWGGNGQVCRPWEYGNPDLFYNFYVPNNCGGVPAAMYVAPLPVPQFVGHTYYTYQPLMPHEFMYKHHRTYRNYYDGGRGIDRTAVIWYCNPVVSVLKDARQAIKLPR